VECDFERRRLLVANELAADRKVLFKLKGETAEPVEFKASETREIRW